MAHYRDSGVIVRTHKLGEADRILSIITENNGKVRAVAKGVRKTRSRFGGRLELLRHLDLQFYKGRGDLDIVTQAETRDHWPDISNDLERLGKALTIAEAVDQLGEAHRMVFTLHCYEGLSYGEIAAVLGIPVGTVMSRLYHARRKIRDALPSDWDPGGASRSRGRDE